MNESVGGDGDDLAATLVEAHRPDSVSRLAALLDERRCEEVGRHFGRRHLRDDGVGDAPERDGAVARPGNDELVVDPGHVENPVLMRALDTRKTALVFNTFLAEPMVSWIAHGLASQAARV